MTTVDLWSCSPNKIESLQRMLADLSHRLPSESHKALEPLVKGVDISTLTHKLDTFYDPNVLAKLCLTIGIEVDPLHDVETIALMKEVRDTCFSLIHAYGAHGTVTSVQAVELYSYICKFKVLFTHPQYGASQSLFKVIISRGLDFLHLNGVTPMFLLLCDLRPDLFTEDCYVIIKHPGVEKLQKFEDLIENDWFFRNLLGKHSTLWNRCVQSQLV